MGAPITIIDHDGSELATRAPFCAVSSYLARLRTDASRRAAASRLRTVARAATGQDDPRAIPWPELTYSRVQALWLAVLASRDYAPRTQLALASAIRGPLDACRREGLITRDEYLARVSAFDNMPDADSADQQGGQGRYVRPAEVARVMAAALDASTREKGLRDVAILALLFGAGLRRAEAAALDLADLDHEAGRIQVRGAKGGKARTVPLARGVLTYLDAWLDVRGREPGPLFNPTSRWGLVYVERRITPTTIGRAVTEAADRAPGVGELTAHDARRTAITELIDAGAPLARVQAIAGHKSPETTAKYDRASLADLDAAARLRSVPDIDLGADVA